MERRFRITESLLVRGGLLVGFSLSSLGCQSTCSKCGSHGHRSHRVANHDACADIPPGALPQPVGTFSNEIHYRHAEKGDADQFVIYYNEWLDNEATLGPFGSDHFVRIVTRLRRGGLAVPSDPSSPESPLPPRTLPGPPYPVIVQPEPEKPELNARRYAALVRALSDAGIADAEKRVFVGRPWAEGLFGDEGPRIYNHIPRGGGGGFGGGGFGGGGFGGGGFGGF